MKRILMLFLDGIGLGADDTDTNPFAVANTPTLHSLANNHPWLASTGKQLSARAAFIPTDPRMNVSGRPQSGTGQATILTGVNVPLLIGRHYGPKPDEATRDLLEQGNFFQEVGDAGKTFALIEAYPPGWHEGVNSGKRLRASYQHAAHSAGQRIFTIDDLIAGKALAVDWTNEGLAKFVNRDDLPIYTLHEAGEKLVEISKTYAFAFHAHWISDTIGHRGTLQEGVDLLESFDGVMKGVLDAWDDDEGLVIITSDHGNMEEIGNRRHTENDVPTVVIGNGKEVFANNLNSLQDFVPLMRQYLDLPIRQNA